jgi:hypothetical protein
MGIIVLFIDSGGLSLGCKVKVMCDDLLSFIFIRHRSNQICSSFKWLLRFLMAISISMSEELMYVSSAKAIWVRLEYGMSAVLRLYSVGARILP